MTGILCIDPSDRVPYKHKFILTGDTWGFVLLPGFNEQDKWEEAKESEEEEDLKSFWG